MRKRTIKNIKDILNLIKSSHIAFVIFLEIIIGAIISLTSFLLFIKIAKNVLENEFYQFDSMIFSFIYSLRTPILTDLMLLISFLGRDIVIFATVAITVFLFFTNHKKEAFLFGFILAMEPVLNNSIKLLTQRPRPVIDPIIIEQTYSFPSEHTMVAFVFWASVSYLIFHFTKNKRLAILVSIFSIIMIILTAISRVYLGVHFPSDVLAGFLGGMAWFVTVLLVRQTLIFYKLFKESKKNN